MGRGKGLEMGIRHRAKSGDLENGLLKMGAQVLDNLVQLDNFL
jgi:hypothetical protein